MSQTSVKRRDLLKLIGGTSLLPAITQAQDRKPAVAFMLAISPRSEVIGESPISPSARHFVVGLRNRGWIDGRNIIIERISLEGRFDQAPAVFSDLVARGVDVIAPPNPLVVLRVAKNLVKTIPMVASLNFDPVIAGLVDSHARPGGNLTGVSSVTGPEVQNKRLQLLKDLAPDAKRIAFLGTRAHWDLFGASRMAADLPRIVAIVETTSDFDTALSHIASEHADALFVSSGGVTLANAPRIAEFATKHRLPTTFERRESVIDGVLMSYGPSTHQTYDLMAAMVDRILRGARVSDMPIEQPTHFEMAVNLKTARELGLTVPPALIAMADELID